MANIKVSEMTEATSFEDGDYTMIVQSNQNKKISHENILGDIETNISTNTNNISTLNTSVGDITNLTTSVKTNVVNAINSLVPIVIYTNDEGSTTNIVLNETIENFKFYEIIYSREGSYGFCSLRMPTDYITDVSLITSTLLNNILRFYIAHITISGTTLTRNYDNYINFTGTNAFNYGTASSVYIHKIIGYR